MERLAAVSVDLDEIPCYAAIYGLTEPPQAALRSVYEKAVPRFEQFFEAHGVSATFFVVGRDAKIGDNAAKLAQLHDRGHELASHSQNHLYDLTRRDRATMRDEVESAQRSIEAVTGRRPRGFRAPGYTITNELVSVLEEAGLEWDSSVFPCPAYYAAKVTAITAIRARGRRSHSIVDDPRVLSAPADPYRMGASYFLRGRGMVELPIGVTRDFTGRLPFIGTSVVLAGARGAGVLATMAVGRPLVNLELHGLDLSDRDEDGLEFLAPHQRDLRIPVAEKMAAIGAAIERLRSAGYRFVTTSEAADVVKAASA